MEDLKVSVAEAMRIAIDQGRKGLGFVAPNPAVGCVVLSRDGRVVGTGYHRRVGGDHAEIDALKSVRDSEELNGATLVVTLEPCAHQGRTPSCARRLAGLPLARVVYGQLDPNPLVNGRGLQMLRDAGIMTEKFEGLNEELAELTEIFFCNVKERRTFVTLKAAVSLDGVLAPEAIPGSASTERRWITNPSSRTMGHRMRAVHDAILIGVGTALSDDPRLDVRHPDFPDKPNKVIILDPGFRLRGRFRDLAMSRCHRESDFLVVVGKSHSTQAHTWPADSVMPFDFDVPPPLRMRELAAELFRAHGISATLVEGGARTYAGFLESRCVDRLSLFVAPKVFGRGLRWSHYFEQASGNLPWGLTNVRSSALGEDVLITGRVEYSQT